MKITDFSVFIFFDFTTDRCLVRKHYCATEACTFSFLLNIDVPYFLFEMHYIIFQNKMKWGEIGVSHFMSL